MPDDAAIAGGSGRRPRFRFPKAARLARTVEFSRVRTSGKPVHGRMMVLGILRDAGTETRVGIVTGRRIGTAVARNRVRRRMREIFRAARARLVPGIWLVIVAKPPAATATTAAIEEEWMQLARRGGILRD